MTAEALSSPDFVSSEPLEDGGDERIEFLDSDVICRYLMNDHAALSPRAAVLIDADRPLRISILTVAEVAHVLRSVYARTPQQVADALIQLLERENIQVHEVDTDLTIEALGLTRPSRRVSIPDALLWAVALAAAPARIWSFDRRFPREGIQVEEPA
jgi:predicted nucleic acid-binding protein